MVGMRRIWEVPIVKFVCLTRIPYFFSLRRDQSCAGLLVRLVRIAVIGDVGSIWREMLLLLLMLLLLEHWCPIGSVLHGATVIRSILHGLLESWVDVIDSLCLSDFDLLPLHKQP